MRICIAFHFETRRNGLDLSSLSGSSLAVHLWHPARRFVCGKGAAEQAADATVSKVEVKLTKFGLDLQISEGGQTS